jgi:KaiC/GvpD/RAD55 family RecA-like ATPase
LPDEEGEPGNEGLEEEAIVDEQEAQPEQGGEASDETPEPEDEGSDDAEPDEEPVMANGGTSVVELNVPDPMVRYMVALQRTPADRDLYADEELEAVPEHDDDEMPARSGDIEHLSIEPEELKHIQETFNVHSIEEILETLKYKEEELVRIKSDFSIKMRNTLALQRIKFEKELNDMKKRMEEYSEYTSADDYLKKMEEELRRKEDALLQKEEDLESMGDGEAIAASAQATGLSVAGADSKDIAELREIIEEQALEVSQLETKMNRARADAEDAKAESEKEKRRRSELEDELDNLKKGSIAMMKYVTSMQRKKAEEDVHDLRSSLDEERRRREELEQELSAKEEALRASDMDVDKAIADAVAAGSSSQDMEAIAELNARVRKRMTIVEAKEKDLELKKRKILSQIKKLKEEKEQTAQHEREELDERMAALPDLQQQVMEKNELIRDLKFQVDGLNDELSKVKKAVDYKDDEFDRRRQELEYKEKLLEKEAKVLQEAKAAAGGSVEVLDAKKEVERLEKVIAEKENELKTKETFLAAKERELQIKEQAVIADNLETSAKEREAEIQAEKAKTGSARLDDLLFGGVPLGGNVLLTGPPFIGKEVLTETFIVEGITKGVPAVLVLSDVSPAEMREALAAHVPSVEEYERLGLLFYIDAYSMPMGVEQEEDNENIVYISEPTAYQDIISAMDKFIKKLKKQHQYFRVVVASISTFITYSDVKATYGFLQKLTGRLKRTHAVSLFPIDEGMHAHTDIQMLGHVMDGSFQFKAENLKTYIAIQGVCDTQSRDWIQYQYTKKGLNIGSFTLSHIR